jgi:hypothetical protein
MGSVPWDCDVLVTASQKAECSGIATHLHVLLSSLLPLLGHGAWPDGAGEHARESEHGKGRADDTDGQEEDLAALIRRRRSSRTVGTEGDEVCYVFVSEWPCTMVLTRSASLSRRAHRCRGPTRVPRRKHPARHSTTRRTTTSARGVRTGLLLLHGQLLPVQLHAVPERHPQVGLLLWGHVLPSLLDVGEGRVGDGVRLAGLLDLADC